MSFSDRGGWLGGYLTWTGSYVALAVGLGALVAVIGGDQPERRGQDASAARERYQACIEAQADAMMRIEDRREMMLAIDAIQDESCDWHIAPYLGEQPYPDPR